MNNAPQKLRSVLDETSTLFDRVLAEQRGALSMRETGTVIYAGRGIVRVQGLPGVRSEELVRFPGNRLGMALNLDPDEVGVILFDQSVSIRAGSEVQRTGRVMDIPVGDELPGRVLDATGRPLDERGSVQFQERRPIERAAPPIIARAPVQVPLQTGIKVIDALLPVGRGQRELILGDRQIGKTALALSAIINQKDKHVVCVYCAIGQQATAVAKVIHALQEQAALKYCVVMVATAEAPPGLQYIAPYAATTIAEYFMEQGRDVLIVYDDLTRHAQAWRELSLLLRRPPGREAYPGDIFYLHARLLERATHLCPELGGGSLTALPIIETEARNIAAYVPTNLISITDGQIYLSPDLFQKGILPAVDVGRSVSRVGGKAQLPAYGAVVSELRLSYSQFEEPEAFSRFETRLDEATRRALGRGRSIREILKQPQDDLLSAAEQIAVLLAAGSGLFDELPAERIARAEQAVRRAVTERLPDLCQRIQAGQKPVADELELLRATARQAIHAEAAAQKKAHADS